MSAKAATLAMPRAGGLDGAGLLVPSLQSEAVLVRAIRPAPCTQACPAGVNVKAYVSLIAEERFGEALEVIRERCPLPGICGRVCHHPCETACERGRVDEPIAIRSLKRFVADLERELPPPPLPLGPERPQRVAVIGSGPAGLTAAYDLRLSGYPVTVFEAESEPGGMLRSGITAYRLPRDILDAEIDVLLRAGVSIQTGRRLGADTQLADLFGNGFSAALIAVGAQLGRKLPLQGSERSVGVEDALEFLRRANGGDHSTPGRRVVVVGGGSTAVEAARTALRLGARSVDILYRRYREELLASTDEVEIAQAEGINFQFLVAPSKLLTEAGRLKGLECLKVGLGEPDASGRRQPLLIPGSEFVVQADRILTAVGQEADFAFLPTEQQARLSRRGLMVVDDETAMTEMNGVFAAGDVVSGPATVIEAIAGGHRAAESIRHFLEEGKPAIREQKPEPRAAVEYELPDAPPTRASRVRPQISSPKPGREFREVEQAFTAAEAVGEARRCMRCGPCGECRVCARSCQRRHVMLRIGNGGAPRGQTVLVRAPGNVAMALDSSRGTPGWLLPTVPARPLPDIDFSRAEPLEILPVRARIEQERCRGCASCVEVCAFGAITVPDLPGPPLAHIEPALCRGCNLCTAVCPTKAASASALSPHWWGLHLADAFRPAAAMSPPADAYIVLACQRRAGGLEAPVVRPGVHIETIRFRCVGQLDAGMLLELSRLGAQGVLVAGCQSARCRFGEGARLAQKEIDRARAILALLGEDPDRIRCDWSTGRATDPLDDRVRKMLEKSCATAPRASRSTRLPGS